ncbi:MAG: hypoxanthine phosphoribosyltransferase [Candidatus Edwardsbacteria bacterium]
MSKEAKNKIGEILVTREQIRKRVIVLGKNISQDYKDKNPLLVGILRGAFVFLADLMRNITIPCEIDFLSVTSYGLASESSGIVRIVQDLNTNIKGRHVIVVEDIVDSGQTLNYILNTLQQRKPKSLNVCALLDKKEARKTEVSLKYVGFTIPKKFVVGYGLDCAEKWRHLPYVAAVLNK